jgi:hypothetical protein
VELRTKELGRKPENSEYVFCNRDGKPIGSFKKSFLAKKMGTGVAMLEKHYGRTSNVAGADELTKVARFKNNKKTKAVDWLMDK